MAGSRLPCGLAKPGAGAGPTLRPCVRHRVLAAAAGRARGRAPHSAKPAARAGAGRPNSPQPRERCTAAAARGI